MNNLSTASDFRRKKVMTQRDFARLGGNAIFAKVGSAGMRERGLKNKEKYGKLYFSSIRKGIKFKE